MPALFKPWIPFSGGKREHLSSIELERGICCALRGEVGGQRLILIKCARLIVFRNPVCHGRCAEKSLWHSLTYGLACCFAQHMLFTVGLVPRALFSRGLGLLLLFIWPPSSTNSLPNLQACLGYSKQLHYSKRLKGRTGGKGREGERRERTEREREYMGFFLLSLLFSSGRKASLVFRQNTSEG